MFTKSGKRIVSLLLALIMIFSVLPVQAFAADNHDHEEGTVAGSDSVVISNEETAEIVRDEVVEEVQTRIDEILDMYLGTTSATLEEIQTMVAEMDEITRMDLQFEILILEEDLEYMDLTAGERFVLVGKNTVMMDLCDVLMEYPTDFAMYSTISVGSISMTDTQNTIKNSNGTVTATAKGGLLSKKTNTITITNTLKTRARLTFNYSVSNASSYNIVGVTNVASGLYSDIIDPGKSVTLSVTSNSGFSNLTVTLTLTNISLVEAKDASNITFQYDNTMGSVTVAGANVESGSQQEIAVTGAELKATAKNGATFLGWINAETHEILSTAATYTLEPAEDMTVQAVFAKNAWFMVNGNMLFEGLDAATAAAATASNKTIILANNGILPAGNYTIPSGITLLIPYNAANTLCTTTPTTSESGFSAPTVYRKLTMAEGAHITVNGAISLSATQSASGGQSAPIGACSFIQMESGSSITVNNGGNLYAWGYIQGSGAVTVENGGTVYECFQVKDWRGGDNTTGMIDNSYRVFPMSQYYIQNIEVPMTLKAGAIEKGYMSVAVTLVGVQGSAVPFIGSDGMFNITGGYIVKDYDENTGRLLIDTYGTIAVKSLSISMKIALLGSATINSSKYTLPINGNMTITMHTGSVTMTQDIALLPGAKLIIGENATCTLGSGNSIYIYDYDQWTTRADTDTTTGEGPSFCGTGDATHINLAYPNSAKNVVGRTDDAYVEVNGVADLSKGYVYTTASGANICGNGTIKMQPGKADAKTYQIKHLKDSGGDEKQEKWFEIPITSAVLQNADGTQVITANDKGVVTYKSVDGVWTCEHTYAADTFTEVIDSNATCDAPGTKTVICNCGEDSYTEEVPALGHTEVVDAAKAPTCTEIGLTEGKHCSVCNTVLVAQKETPALGHTAGAEATCTTAQTCTVCGTELKAALGHTVVADTAIAPTCTETGLTEGSHCSVCGEVLIKQDVVDALGHTAGAEATCTTAQTCTVCGAEIQKALGHTEVVDAAKAPTCTETGLTEGKHCSVCNTVLVKQDVVDALGHTAGADATCTTAQTCTVCNAELVAALGHKPGAEATCTTAQTCTVCGEELVAALNHDMIRDDEVPATCTKPGSQGGAHCSRCDYTEGGGEIPALGHKPGAEATCTTAQTCTVCGFELVAALDHTPVTDKAVAPTCTETGLTEGSHCSACNEVFVKQEVVDALGHTAGAEPTCTTAQTCTVCNAELAAALGHKPGAEATCTTAQTCTVCNAELATALGHKPGAEATCTTAQTCTVCGAELTAALGHDEIDHSAKAPTCTEIGWEAYVTCSRCDYTTYAEIPAAGHGVMLQNKGVAATCQKEGIVAHYRCADCGAIFADVDATKPLASTVAPIDPNNHAFATEGEITAATCKAEGKIEYPCQNAGCKEKQVETLPVNPEGHVWDEGDPYGNHSCNTTSYMVYTCTLCREENWVVVREQHFRVPIADEIPATCTTDGMTSGMKCEKCNEFWIPQEVIPALGHDWNGNLPCQSETSACTRCDLHFDTKQEHLVVTVAGSPATCTTTGLTEGAYCGYCGQILVEQTEIPMTEHNWITTEMEIPATCNSVGHAAGATYCMDCEYDENAKPALEHEWMHRDAKKATYSAIGWNAHDYCLLCNTTRTLEQYEGDPCEFCGENPEGYIEIPKVEVQKIATADEFLTNLGLLEVLAEQYALEHPGEDPLALVLNYMRTAVANYTTGSWAIMAGPENKDFLKFVQEAEDAINSDPELDVWINISGLKKLGSYTSPSNEQNHYRTYNSKVPFLTGHFFGTMDMTYHNKGSQNHADVGGWVGDLTDLLSTTDEFGVPANLTLEEKVAYITNNYLFKDDKSGSAGAFGSQDLYADLEAYYLMNELMTKGYNAGDLEMLIREYFKPGLTLQQRAAYLLTNRLDGLSTRKDLRTAVYNAYTSNKLIATLEGTRNFNASGSELAELRKAVCYAFADEMCRLAGDYVEDLTNPRYTVFDTETKILAPGISQQISYATNADGKQIVFYIATADVNRDDVGMWVNYYDRDPGTPENPEWKNNSVPSSAQNAQDRYGDPNSPDYIPNFSVIASTNAGGYDMSDVATPGGLVVMNGIEWYPQKGNAGFFAILSDGTAYMGNHDEYEEMMAAGLIQEAIGGFGEFVVKDGKVVGNATYSDAPRTSVGITATGRVVIMCIDGRQAPFSSGASLQDVGYIMREAGCVIAINLDGGGSTTFVARQPGSDDLTIMNSPSDGYPRNVSTNLLIYSTAPSSTAFDHADIESEYDYATIGTTVQMNAIGVSPSGNAVDVPEDATWAVSDEEWAFITEEGLFVAKRLGEFTVYLMQGDQVIGSKLMTITNPDQLYFEKAKVDAIYGSSVKLPLLARFEGKPIAINPDDVTITLSAPAAGMMEGFNFVASESAVKTLTITAALNDSAKASINVMLYKQGENSFDFDKATGGDRTLAWHREVTNAKVEDGNMYNVINPSEDMVASYIFAMDMTAIPIPERLQELTYMLPGGTVEGTNAWTFLTSLAQRISDLSWVKATIDFDDRFVVDYSQLKILNDYFTTKSLEFDETTNTLTLTMQWIKQSQVIDAATANPLCLINGIKLTPKEGVWEDTSKINVVTSGTIGYEIYMRASGLYGFAQKPESQAVFGVYPYRNPNDTSDAGGYFRDTYVEIVDEYTLVNVLKEGWVNEDGGFAYYIEGERLTGIQQVEGFYYDFGETGINVGQTKLTGLFYQQTSETEGLWYYSYIGELVNGWQSINGSWYYFNPKNNAAVSGDFKISGVKFHFEENGQLTNGVWVKTLSGTRYYYGPGVYWNLWHEVDGEMYYFSEGYRVTGFNWVTYPENVSKYGWAYFDENGKYVNLGDGIFEIDGTLFYFENGYSVEKGLVCLNDEYYFTVSRGRVIANTVDYYAYLTSCDMPCGRYSFDAQGRMIGSSNEGEVALKNGVLYYFERGVGQEKGLVCVDGDYYFTVGNGRVIINEVKYAYLTNCDLPCGHYEFGADGKMLQGIVEKSGTYYYYENGVGAEKGLICVDGDYYFTVNKGRVIVSQDAYYAYMTNCDMPCGRYNFGADGKMIGSSKEGEIVEKDGTLYYYENGAGAEKGLVCVNGDYYFTVNKGRVITNEVKYAYLTNCDLPCGRYEFGADGKMVQGIIEKEGTYYYYENGVGVEKGLICYNGDYYFTVNKGRVIVSQESYYAYQTSCDMPCGRYEFDAEGKMIGSSKTGEIVTKDGTMYYYEKGAGVEKGLICMDGAYYYTVGRGRIIVNETKYAYLTNCDMPCGTYEFGADGKMIGSSKTGEIVVKNGTMYYYESGAAVEKGLICLDGAYYFTVNKGRVIVNEVKYAYLTNCDLPCGNYEFGADGKMIGSSATGEIVNKNGVDYYYEKGQKVNKGLIQLDGAYYYIIPGGNVVKGKMHYVSITNDLLPAGNYDFDADGKMIGSNPNGEIVNRNGVLYYYENGVRVNQKGLVYIDGYYYFVGDNGRLAVNCRQNVWEANGLLIEGYYYFNELGQLIG